MATLGLTALAGRSHDRSGHVAKASLCLTIFTVWAIRNKLLVVNTLKCGRGQGIFPHNKYVFIPGLFKYWVNNEKWVMNWGKRWENSGPKLIPEIYTEGLTKTTRNLSQCWPSRGQQLRPGSPENETGVSTTEPWRLSNDNERSILVSLAPNISALNVISSFF